MPRKQITYAAVHNGHKIQQGETGSIVQILDGTEARLNYMKEKRYSQIGIVHLDVTVPDSVDAKRELSSAVGKSCSELHKQLVKQGTDNQYLWVREESESRNDGKPHAHIAFLFDSMIVE